MRYAMILALGGTALIVLVSFVLSWPVYMLWNGCLVSAIDGVNEITWLQAWGIAILCGFLFNSSTPVSAK